MVLAVGGYPVNEFIKSIARKCLSDKQYKTLQRPYSSIKRNVSFFVHYKDYLDYKKEIQNRSGLSIFDYKGLAKDMPLVTRETGFSPFYGLDHIVKKIYGIPEWRNLPGRIEHGFYPCNDISKADTDMNVIYTMSGTRKSYLEKMLPNKKIYALGPYIQYVDGMYSASDASKIKKELGKTLVVFPFHSTHHVIVGTTRNIFQSFIDEINKVKAMHHFDTVLVNLYWKDILLGRDEIYLKNGYRICTAGHIYDTNFLRRLKSIIAIADMTMGNDVGTHIGYTISEGKSHYLYYTNSFIESDDPHEGENLSEENVKFHEMVLSDMKEAFGTYHENITEAAKRCFCKYFDK